MISKISSTHSTWSFLKALLPVLIMACGQPPSSDNGLETHIPGAIDVENWPELDIPVAQDPEMEAAITELMAKMSLEEKVGQVIQGEIRYTTPADVREYHLGSVLNGGGAFPNNDKHSTPADWLALADAYYEASMDTSDGGQPIPILWGSDAVHGHNNVIGATLFPHNIGLGATGNSTLR